MELRLRRGLAALALVVAGTALVGGLSACGGSGGGSTIEIGAPPVVGLGDLYVAEQRGLFKEQGLKVKLHELNGGAALVPALQSNSIDVGHSNLVSILQGAEHHLDVKCFAGGYRTPSRPQLPLLASPKASIHTPADLAGKTIAVNTLGNANQLIAESYLQSKGVNPKSVKFVALEYPDMPGALASGRVDAAITDEPFGTTARSRGATVIAAQPDAAIATHPMYPCWVATTKWLDANKGRVRKFAAALREADAYMAKHPDYLRSILPKYTEVSSGLAKRVSLPDFDALLVATDLQPWSRAAHRLGMTKSAVDPSSVLQTGG